MSHTGVKVFEQRLSLRIIIYRHYLQLRNSAWSIAYSKTKHSTKNRWEYRQIYDFTMEVLMGIKNIPKATKNMNLLKINLMKYEAEFMVS